MKKYYLQDLGERIETHIDFKGDLNITQYEIVSVSDGACLVPAGAGSGKTRTLIYRLAYLLEKGISPYNILLMTFTNKAAREMRQRTGMLLNYEPKGLWSGTFHHIGNRSLRLYADQIGFQPDFGILDQDDSKSLIKTCVKKIKKQIINDKFPKASVIQSIISLSSNTKRTIDKVLEQKYPYFEKFALQINQIKEMYTKKKYESNNMDYDDLLLKWKYLLETVPEARERFTDQFHYIMVDEYQDTNYLQAEIIDILCEKHKNILVVGDDAQSIYSFRGARVDNILSFPDRVKGSKIFKLETNYRSTPQILELANDSLQNNLNQFEKSLKAVNNRGEQPALVEVRDLYSQAKFVTQRLNELLESGSSLKDIAVLFRAHYQSAELEMELVKKGIPYVVRGGIRFFEQTHVKDATAYMKIAANPVDEVAWLRALTLCPGIGPGYAQKIYDHFRNSGRDIVAFIRSEDISGIVPLKAREGYKKFRKIVISITDPQETVQPADMIKVLEEGYETHLLAAFDNAKDRIDDLHELVNFAHTYTDTNIFLSDITLREDFRSEGVMQEGHEEDLLVLSTIHQSKGLEWDAVMLIGLCEGQFPNPKAFAGENDLEEERRLFYVAVTRAKKYLYMIHPNMRYDYQKGMIVAKRSMFLDELFQEDYEVWQVGSSQTRYVDDPDDSSYDDYEDEIIEL